MRTRNSGLLLITLLLMLVTTVSAAKSDHANTRAMPPSYGPGTEIFKDPRYRGNAVDKCLYTRGDRQCGKPAADRFCELNGYRQSITYDLRERHGNTFLLGSETQCRGPSCDSLRAVACKQPFNNRPPNRPPAGDGTSNFFQTPTSNGYQVDKCLFKNRSCGKPAADAFCQNKGYRKADSYRTSYARNTWHLKEGRVCSYNCEAINSVRCSGKSNHQGGGSGQTGVFEYPKYRGIPVDECMRRGRDCGFKAAEGFCHTKGYKNASSYRVANSRERTWLLGDARYCSGSSCKELRNVRCENRTNNPGHGKDFFAEPKHRGYRVSRCITEGKGCGNKAADEFCQLQGYRSASKYERWRDAGPTIRLGNQRVCSKRSCDAIKNVQCSYQPPKNDHNDNNNRERVFREPAYRGYPVSRCLFEGRECDQYAADEFCRINGYREALDWHRKEDVGPTIRLGSRKLCNKWSCDGLEDVVCSR